MPTRTIFITGAGRGIGRATALRFARSGDAIALMSRTADELTETAALVQELGGRALSIRADVSSEADVQAAVETARKKYGSIHVLVNTAGVAPLSPLADMSTSTFDNLIAVNVRGVFLTCRAVWPIMAAAGGGIIINVSSMSARDPFPGLGVYGASKAFVELITRGLAAEGRALGIRAFGVAPGAVETRMLLDLFPDFPSDKMLKPDDVAGLIEWLCDPRCATSAGQTLTISRDG